MIVLEKPDLSDVERLEAGEKLTQEGARPFTRSGKKKIFRKQVMETMQTIRTSTSSSHNDTPVNLVLNTEENKE